MGNSLSNASRYSPQHNVGQYIGTYFRYEHGYITDLSGYGECDFTGDAFKRVNRWEGSGISLMYDVSVYNCNQDPRWHYVDWYPQWGGWTKNSSRAARFGVAVSLAGVTLGATSGFSSRVDMRWDAVRGPLKICGGNNIPAYANIIYTSNG